MARVELGGKDFWPPGCGPGSPAAGRSATGGHCRPTSGDTVLAYWEFTLSVGQARRSAPCVCPPQPRCLRFWIYQPCNPKSCEENANSCLKISIASKVTHHVSPYGRASLC